MAGTDNTPYTTIKENTKMSVNIELKKPDTVSYEEFSNGIMTALRGNRAFLENDIIVDADTGRSNGIVNIALAGIDPDEGDGERNPNHLKIRADSSDAVMVIDRPSVYDCLRNTKVETLLSILLKRQYSNDEEIDAARRILNERIAMKDAIIKKLSGDTGLTIFRERLKSIEKSRLELYYCILVYDDSNRKVAMCVPDERPYVFKTRECALAYALMCYPDRYDLTVCQIKNTNGCIRGYDDLGNTDTLGVLKVSVRKKAFDFLELFA